MKISSCLIDGAQERQGSIDGTDVQSENKRSHFCAGRSQWRGSRPAFGCRLQSRHSLGWRLCRCDLVQADDRLLGHPRVSYRHLCCSNTQFFWHAIFRKDARDRVCRKHDPWGSVCVTLLYFVCVRVGIRMRSGHEYMHRHEHSCTHLALLPLGSRFF